MPRVIGSLRIVSEWINKKGPGLIFFTEDVASDTALTPIQVRRALYDLQIRKGWGITQPAGQNSYMWNGSISSDLKPITEPKATDMVFEFLAWSKQGKALLRNTEGELWVAMQMDIDF